MSSISNLPADAATRTLTDSKADRFLLSAGQSPASDAKLRRSAHEFEAILIAKWLEEAEASFARLPGDEDDPAADPGQDQFRSMAQQFLAESISSAGGVGISAMIVRHLEQPAGRPQAIDNKGVNSQSKGEPVATSSNTP